MLKIFNNQKGMTDCCGKSLYANEVDQLTDIEIKILIHKLGAGTILD